MGATLQRDAAMGPYRVEVRRESFYLHRDSLDAVQVMGRYELCVPASEASAIQAALRQVVGHLAWQEWQDSDAAPFDTSWTLPPGGEGPAAEADWTVARRGDLLAIRGPWVVYSRSVEIAYQDTRAFADALASAVG